MDRLPDRVDPFHALLSALTQRIAADTGIEVRVGAELECYVSPLEHHAGFIACMSMEAASRGLPLLRIDQESTPEQLELVLGPISPPLLAADTIEATRRLAVEAAAHCNAAITFAARPYPDQPGSGLHLNISLHDEDGQNLLYKKDEVESDALRFAIGGLCATMREAMLCFAPTEDAYLRYERTHHVPVNVSWGANNRTTALRLPASLSGLKVIEHRVAGAGSNPHLALCAILAGIHYGLMQDITPGPQIFGNAFLLDGEVPPLPATLAESQEAARQACILPTYFGEDIWAKLVTPHEI
jgi:glutamine synthetase